MIKNISLFICLLSWSAFSQAVLLERLGGLAYYDDEADLTWLADANFAQTSGYDDDGQMTWDDANTWATGLNVAGITGWRLSESLQPDANCSGQSFNGGYSESFGYTCTGSEFGNLFYNVLGGSSGSYISTTHNANYDLFSNIQLFSVGYWTSTERASSNGLQVWGFDTSGYQASTNKGSSSNWYAWAVHSGDVSAVPIPSAVWLFGSGIIGLIGIARRKKHNN